MLLVVQRNIPLPLVLIHSLRARVYVHILCECIIIMESNVCSWHMHTQSSPHSSAINLIGFANAPPNDGYSARLKLLANYCLWVVDVVVPFTNGAITMQHPIYLGCTNRAMSTSTAKQAILIQLQWCESADLNLMLTWARQKKNSE